MKTRTKFVVLAIVSLYVDLIANIVLSLLGKELLSDMFNTAWMTSFTLELGLLAGLKIKGKGE